MSEKKNNSKPDAANTSDQKVVGGSHASRRIKYTINVVVAVAVAIAIAVLLNVIVFNKRELLPRFDWTTTRQYTLSEQTQNVIGRVEDDVKIMTLFHEPKAASTANEATQKAVQRRKERISDARDLVNEYARQSAKITAEHIDPVFDPKRYDAFLMSVRERFAASINPLKQAVDEARFATDAAKLDIDSLRDQVDQISDDRAITNPGTKKMIVGLVNKFVITNIEINNNEQKIDEILDQTLPDYDVALKAYRGQLTVIESQFYRSLVEDVEGIARLSTTPNAVKDRLLRLKDQFEEARKNIGDSLDKIATIETDAGYAETRKEVLTSNPVVFVSKHEIRAVPLDNMFKQLQSEPSEDGVVAEPTFRGEELLTGALVRMQMKTPPMVVFVMTGQVPPIGRIQATTAHITHYQVAQRLAQMNFEVRMHNPAPTVNQQGQRIPASPPPQPKPGQPIVWVFPAAQLAKQNSTDLHRPLVGRLLNDRLNAGDPCLVMFGPDPNARFGSNDPIVRIIERWGILPQVDRAVFQEIPIDETRTSARLLFIKQDWPDEPAVAAAVKGMPAAFVQSCPLLIEGGDSKPKTNVDDSGAGESKGATIGAVVKPLVTFDKPRMWTEQEFTELSSLQFKEATSKPEFVIAATAEHEDTRLIVIGNAFWASDYVTTNHHPLLPAQGIGGAATYGAAYPGNSELFVNSIYWLAGLDELIARGARAQDIRRVGPIPDSNMTRLKWTLTGGMPLGILLIGLTVYYVRRKG